MTLQAPHSAATLRRKLGDSMKAHERVCRSSGCERSDMLQLRMCPEHYKNELERLTDRRYAERQTAKTRAGKGGPVRVDVDTEAIKRALAAAGPQGIHLLDLCAVVGESEYRVRSACVAMGIQKLRRGRHVYLVGQ